jgi:hypothetical protein
MADKKRDILEFVKQSNFEQFTPTHFDQLPKFASYFLAVDQIFQSTD